MKTVIIGLQYGDEAKGRVSAYFIKDYEWSIRFCGGPNAGHTVYDLDGQVHKLHHIPAGAVFGKKIALDAGMVIDYSKLKRELSSLNMSVSDIYINESVHMISAKHKELDSSGSGLGTTKSGIAYVYADRALKKGIRAKQFFTGTEKPKLYRGLPPISYSESALFEGAQGIMLDVDHGHYPYVTSSSIMPSMAHRIYHTIGVMKGYTTRVGDGPPHYDPIPDLTVLGNEYGTTTGRPRRCYWNDMDQLRYAFSIVNPDEVVVTKLDILKDFPNICVYDGGSLKTIGNLDLYKEFLMSKFPQIKWFSEAPSGDLIEA